MELIVYKLMPQGDKDLMMNFQYKNGCKLKFTKGQLSNGAASKKILMTNWLHYAALLLQVFKSPLLVDSSYCM